MKDIQYLTDRLAPELQYIGNNEELVYLYLKNDEGLTGRILSSLFNVMSAELSFYINRLTNTKGRLNPISVTREVGDKTDLIILIRKEELNGIQIEDELEGWRYTSKTFPINKFKEGKDVKLRVIKQYEGSKREVMNYMGEQILLEV